MRGIRNSPYHNKKSLRHETSLFDSNISASFIEEQHSCMSNRFMDSINVDYQSKTFQLMKQNVKLEMLLKNSHKDVGILESEVAEMNRKMEEIFQVFGIDFSNINKENQFGRAVLEMQKILKQVFTINHQQSMGEYGSQRRSVLTDVNEERGAEKQFDKIIGEYKNMVSLQLNNLQKMKRGQEQERGNWVRERMSLESQIESLRKEKNALESELKVISAKKQLQIAELHDQIQELSSSLQKQISLTKEVERDREKMATKYKTEIENFEEMERIVEEKLIQVEEQMNFYKKERVQHRREIEELRKMTQPHNFTDLSDENYYSFGEKTKEVEVQTNWEKGEEIRKQEGQGQDRNWQQECLEESIKTLLWENKRLKSILSKLNHLMTQSGGCQLEEELKLELKLLMVMN